MARFEGRGRRVRSLALAASAFLAIFAGVRLVFDEPDERAAARLLENAMAGLARPEADGKSVERLIDRATASSLRLSVAEDPRLAPGRAGLLELWQRARKLEGFALDVEVTHVDLYEEPRRVRALGEASWTFSRAKETKSQRRSIEVWLEGSGESLRVASLAVAGPTHEEPEPRP
jgi:hypothetical protein